MIGHVNERTMISFEVSWMLCKVRVRGKVRYLKVDWRRPFKWEIDKISVQAIEWKRARSDRRASRVHQLQGRRIHDPTMNPLYESRAVVIILLKAWK